MEIFQSVYKEDKGWSISLSESAGVDYQLIFVFGSTEMITKGPIEDILIAFPQAYIVGGSTAGEILGAEVLDDSLSITAVSFKATSLKTVLVNFKDVGGDSYLAGKQLIDQIDREGLKHIFLLSEGINFNGSKLVSGIKDSLSDDIAVTGGMMGDGSRWEETYVVYGKQVLRDVAVAVCFYGESIRIGYGSVGGWDSFGPERVVTKSKDNVLYQLDWQSALEIYKMYLGEHAKKLPLSGLLYPLSLRSEGEDHSLVRTVVAVNEDDQSLTFAGDIPEGSLARLMRANFDRLVDGAAGAAKNSKVFLNDQKAQLAILVSCVGRKLILKQRIEEEVETVQDILGSQITMTGFYSYGEISPVVEKAQCEFHNQTMTITTFYED